MLFDLNSEAGFGILSSSSISSNHILHNFHILIFDLPCYLFDHKTAGVGDNSLRKCKL